MPNRTVFFRKPAQRRVGIVHGNPELRFGREVMIDVEHHDIRLCSDPAGECVGLVDAAREKPPPSGGACTRSDRIFWRTSIGRNWLNGNTPLAFSALTTA